MNSSVAIFSKEEMLFETSKKEHILFKTALICCKNIGEEKYQFETNIYPAYLIVKKYFEVLMLDFCSIKYHN
ncbi:MAG: hypothetical protein IJA32_00030 [Lachnospiraceae bacterium]|nr:hypothetical protein [Lachnospiraceae bacterium]MBQ3544583.1 hypothetical protein [Lachnospiraceae bacterium]